MCGCLGYGVSLALRGREQMFLGFDMAEWLGAAFSGCLVMLSLWLLYQWGIKPERETRRQIARRATEEMHRNHWEHFRGRIYPPQEGTEAFRTKGKTTANLNRGLIDDF